MAKTGKVSGWVYKCELDEIDNMPLVFDEFDSRLLVMPLAKTKPDLHYFCACQADVRPLPARRRKNNCKSIKLEYRWVIK